MKGRIEIETERCKECGLCIISCKQTLICKSGSHNAKGFFEAVFEDPESRCNGCALCAIVCPEVAIEVYRE